MGAPTTSLRRPRRRRFLFRRLFYLQLPRIVADALARRDGRPRVFVSMIGGLGDLVNLFPSLERLSEHYAVDVGTGPDPCRALVRQHPHVARVYSPFVYKPIRRGHRRLIEALLRPLYARVILLDEPDSAWRNRGTHFSRVYAERCGCPPPARGAVYLSEESRLRAGRYLAGAGLDGFVHVAQAIRHERMFRCWPLTHYHALYRMIRERFDLPVAVSTAGSDETDVPPDCHRFEPTDILTAAAIIERARLFIGPDSGPTHIAAALGVPTIAIHLGYPPEACGALGDNVTLIRQARPLAEPADTRPAEVFRAVAAALEGSMTRDR